MTRFYKLSQTRLTHTYARYTISSLRDSTLMGRCPTCKQLLGTQAMQLPVGRICFLCERRIGIHEKYINTRGGVRHRDCSDPESYGPVVIDVATVEVVEGST